MSEVAQNHRRLPQGLRRTAFVLLAAMVSLAAPCAESMLALGAECESAAEDPNEWLAPAHSRICRLQRHRSFSRPKASDTDDSKRYALRHSGVSMFPGHRLSNGLLAPLRC